jgi:hypothetical protein
MVRHGGSMLLGVCCPIKPHLAFFSLRSEVKDVHAVEVVAWYDAMTRSHDIAGFEAGKWGGQPSIDN